MASNRFLPISDVPVEHDVQRLALVLGALLISLLWRFFFVTASHPPDQLGQGVASVVALLLLAPFARQLQQQQGIP